ncbi:VTT domain-containing protein [Lysinibacillus sp. 3P01SB]|uniref:VTT domain-containing protein n=1 Tax=Lysinibacillus sp. 3P01SB TaxID=3132284 RepID=UPI0039A50625
MSIAEIFEFLRMVDTELYSYIKKFGIAIYFLLFAVVFTKTAFVVLTFLPGDSLVFASGTLAALDKLDIVTLFILYFIATTLADSNNYLIGKLLGNIPEEKSILFRFIPSDILTRAKTFIQDYDRVALTFSRFVPLMRTMTPFISGFTQYPYKKFVRYNMFGALLWTCVWLFSGYALGNIPWVADNLMFTLLLISAVVLLPTIYAYVKQMVKNQKEPDESAS